MFETSFPLGTQCITHKDNNTVFYEHAKGQTPLHQFPRSKSATSWQLPCLRGTCLMDSEHNAADQGGWWRYSDVGAVIAMPVCRVYIKTVHQCLWIWYTKLSLFLRYNLGCCSWAAACWDMSSNSVRCGDDWLMMMMMVMMLPVLSSRKFNLGVSVVRRI